MLSVLCTGNRTAAKSSALTQEEMRLISMGIVKEKVNDLRNLAETSVNTGKPICVIGECRGKHLSSA